ncbi:hypothetical protein ACWCQ0_50870, partial [Streptomyces massasporeus]
TAAETASARPATRPGDLARRPDGAIRGGDLSRDLMYDFSYVFTRAPAYAFTRPPAYVFTRAPTRVFTRAPTHLFTRAPTHLFTRGPTYAARTT